jgi:gliding motility-associated protein GldM
MDTRAVYYDADGKKQTWEMHNFYHTILAANVTILNEIKAEVYNAQFDVVNHLYSAIDAMDFKFDKIEAKVVPRSRFIFSGEEYTAQIIVAAYDSKNNPTIKYIMGADTITPGNEANAKTLTSEDGVGMLKFMAGAEGLQKFAGFVEVVNPAGETKKHYFSSDYMVSKTAISISPTAMNVFYKGVDNPVSITVPGGAEKIEPRMSFGSIKKVGNDYIVNIPAQGAPARVTLSVNATYGGKSKPMGAMEFRVKDIPPPMVKLATKSEGAISRSLIQASPVLVCEPPVGFDFNISYTVVSYKFQTATAGGEGDIKAGTGNQLTPDIMSIIKSARKNQRIWIEEIKVKGPSGEIKLPYSLSFKII